jgi:4-hydroxy-tetrahydrodipicolinate synthase
MVTPFKRSGDLDLEAARREASFLVRAGVNGLVVGGSTGEGYAMKADELKAVCTTVRNTAKKLAGDEFPVLAGVIANSTKEAIEYALAAREAGADGVQMTPMPTYLYKPDIKDTVKAFRDVGEAVGLPIVIYNVVPTNRLSAADFQKIASVKQVVGVKQSGVDIHTLADVILAVGGRMAVLSALDDMLLPSLILGAKGSISAACSILPDMCVELFRLYRQKKIEACLPLHWKILRVVRVTVYRGLNDVYGDMLGRVKFAINAQGRNVGYPRAPVSLPSDDVKAEILAALRFAGRPVNPKLR